MALRARARKGSQGDGNSCLFLKRRNELKPPKTAQCYRRSGPAPELGRPRAARAQSLASRLRCLAWLYCCAWFYCCAWLCSCARLGSLSCFRCCFPRLRLRSGCFRSSGLGDSLAPRFRSSSSLDEKILQAFGGPGQSQAPKTIKIVVPFTPGGGSDLLGRILADHVRRTEGIAAVVENRAGAGSVSGTDVVSRAAPDGATLLINTPNIVIAAHLRKLNYDPPTSFEPICRLGSSPALVVVNSSSLFRSLADLVGAARGRPGILTLASVGPATAVWPPR
jgi:hypothetical protein